jgi:Glycosyl transferase family 11
MKANPNLSQSNDIAKNRTIVFTHGGGRFGNQMFSYAQLLAFALEYDNIDFVNMACWEYADLLETGQQDAICSKSSRKHPFYRFLYFFCTVLYIKNDSVAKNIIIHLLYFFAGNPLAKYYGTQSICVEKAWTDEKLLMAQKLPDLDLADPATFDLINQSKTTLLSGWGICDWKLVEKHQDKIREVLKVQYKYFDISNSFIADKRQKYDFIVGVMIRQGDYKLWKDGQYYFSIEQYSQWIDRLSEVFQSRGKVGFILASDASQNLKDFTSQNVHFTTGIANSSGHYIESISQLSLCDVIMSPPSSFSLWAAFLGDIPFIPLVDSQQVMAAERALNKSFFDCVGIAY